MSGCLNCLLAGKGSVVVSGSLSGSGSISIPAGVTSVSLTGAGGIGTQTYNPEVGSPSYPGGLPPYSPAVYYYNWTYTGSTITSSSGSPLYALGGGIPNNYPGYTPVSPVVSYNAGPSYSMYNSGSGLYDNYHSDQYKADTIGGILTPQQGEPAYPSGLPPYQSSYYSYTYGPSTTASLNSNNASWQGGYGVVVGTTSTQNLTSNGLGQTLTYSIGTGGFLNYSYTI